MILMMTMGIKQKIKKIKWNRLSSTEKVLFYIQESKKLINQKNVYVTLVEHPYKGENKIN